MLLVEDDPDVARALCAALEELDYTVDHAASAAAAHAVLDVARPDAVILDLQLPDADGLILCGDLKARAGVPILVCSALPPHPNAVLSLRLGADDFISKPFRLDDLEARLAAALRRRRDGGLERTSAGQAGGAFPAGSVASWGHQPSGPVDLCVGPLIIERGARAVTLAGVPVPLTPTEYRLLEALAQTAGDALSREELGHSIWGCYDPAIGRSIDVHVTRLRAKLATAQRGVGNDEGEPAVKIDAVRGFGFRITALATQEPAEMELRRAS